MAFEQILRAYLEVLESDAPAGPAVPVRMIEEPELHLHFLARMREFERAGRQGMVAYLFDKWPEQLPRFVRYLATLPMQLCPVDRDGALGYARRALDAAMGCSDPQLALVDRLELQRIVTGFGAGAVEIERYAVENRLVRRGGPNSFQLTELGRVFLRLRGKEAIRWLVTSELVQSTGPTDPWHVSHGVLEEASTTRGITVSFQDESDRRLNDTLRRLTGLGLLVDLAEEDPDVAEYRVISTMQAVVQAVLEAGPWHSAVKALLDDEQAAVLPGGSSSATEANIEQTKLIAHEVRNALIPVRHDLDALRALGAQHDQLQRMDAARQGVVRVLEFIDALVQTSELVTEPGTRCEIGTVVDEALGWIDTNRRVSRLPAPAIYLIAPRARLARAISNIVGNALQSTTSGQPVRLSIERARDMARVVVDDGGPGVPIEHRVRVFLEGVTMRQDGTGSGFGLAFVRRVVEEALHGRVWCEDSDLGGARFVIEVPVSSTE